MQPGFKSVTLTIPIAFLRPSQVVIVQIQYAIDFGASCGVHRGTKSGDSLGAAQIQYSKMLLPIEKSDETVCKLHCEIQEQGL